MQEVRDALAEHAGVIIHPQNVLLTSDESDPAWWADVKEMGWSFVDHAKERTKEDLGRWYPVFIDAVIQSAGTGFVGTQGSTMSLLALRRVMDWNNGLGKMVSCYSFIAASCSLNTFRFHGVLECIASPHNASSRPALVFLHHTLTLESLTHPCITMYQHISLCSALSVCSFSYTLGTFITYTLLLSSHGLAFTYRMQTYIHPTAFFSWASGQGEGRCTRYPTNIL